jgi:hypothetical protein
LKPDSVRRTDVHTIYANIMVNSHTSATDLGYSTAANQRPSVQKRIDLTRLDVAPGGSFAVKKPGVLLQVGGSNSQPGTDEHRHR